MRILVVEDEEELAAVLIEALADQHYAVDLAPDGASADESWPRSTTTTSWCSIGRSRRRMA